MKKNNSTKCVSSVNKLLFTLLLPLFALFLSVNGLMAQQVIGYHPSMDGGFENQTGTLSNTLSPTVWSVSSTSNGTHTISATGGRSGSKFVTFGYTTTSTKRLQSPTANTDESAVYTLQFYYKTSGSTGPTNMRLGVGTNGTSNNVYTAITLSGTSGEWTKASGQVTASGTAGTSGWAGLQANGTMGSVNIDIDDFVCYVAGTVDVTAPDPVTSPNQVAAAATQQSIGWTSPASIDGGGFMVVRSDVSDPSTAPKVNGIYAVGNFVAGVEKVVYLGTNNSFVDLGLTASTTYYYRIYTVDKAFNYSTAATLTAATGAPSYASEPTSQASSINFSSVTSSGMTINWTAGDGTNSLVVVRAATAFNDDPTDGGTYAPSTTYGSGTQIGTGNYSVYNGTGNSVTITGLSKAINYYVKVYTFNGSGGSENYLLTSPASGNQMSLPGEITSNGSSSAGVSWSTLGAWTGGVVPGAGDNVTIAAGDKIIVASTSSCYNLTIPATAKVYNNVALPTTSLTYLTVYGTSILCDGTLGDKITNGSADGALGILFNGNLTVNGTGTIRPARLRPNNNTQNATLTINANTEMTYTGGTGGGGAAIYTDVSGNDNITITINPGKTLSFLSGAYLNTASSGATNGTANTTFNVNGTLTLPTGSNLSLPITSGKSCTLNVGSSGIVNIGSNLNATSATGGTAPSISNAGTITVGGVADFSSTTLSAYVGGSGIFTLLSGATINTAAASGLEPVAGPIRTSTRNFNVGANYGFVGTAAQVPGSDFPATVNNLTINNAFGVTLNAGTTVNGALTLTAGELATGANTVTLKGAISGTGTIATGASGTLTFAGSAVQTLDGANVTSNAINNLVLEGGSRLTTSGAIAATNLTINSSNLRVAGTLLGTLTATNTTVNQYLGDARNWYISSPVSNAKAPAGYTYYQRDEAGVSWTSQPFVATDEFLAGKGYIAMPGSTGSTLSFVTETGGSLNTGNVTVALTRASTTTGIGYNLIGNPYPSHLAWTAAFVDDVTNATIIDPTIWIRTNSGSSNTGGWSYQTYNGHSSEAAPLTALLTGGIIPPMQAFWVKALKSDDLILDNKLIRSHQASIALKAPAIKNTDRQRLRLQVDNGTSTDETLIYFDAAALDTYDRYDSPKFMETSASTTQIYTTAGAEKLVINGMNSIPLNTPIGLGFVSGSATTFTIKANEISNIPSDVKVILKDNVSLIETDLTDGISSYSFSPKTISENRFSVIFRSSGSATGINSLYDNSILVYYNNSKGITINTNNEELIGSTVAVFNTLGEQLISKKLSGTSMNIDYPYTPNVYFVKVNNIVTKVIVK